MTPLPTNICIRCGERFHNAHVCPVQNPTALPAIPPLQTGWLCPACGRGNAPMNMTCPCKERERLKQSIRHSLTIGPKTIQTRVYFGEVEVSMVKMPIEEVVAAEREACAKLVEHYRSDWDMADTIRARGDKT